MSAWIEPTAEQYRTLTRWRVSTFWVMLLGYVGYYLCRGNLSVAAPLLSREFGYSNTELGIIFTFSEMAYAFGKFTTGPWADKIGGRRIFLTGMAGAIFFNLLFVQFSTLFMFALVWSLCRFFLSMGWGGIIKTIGAWYEPEKNGRIMGLISINFQSGAAIASIFCGFLLSWGSDWQGLFIYPAAVVSVIWIWSFLSSRESPQSVFPRIRFGQNASTRKSMAGFEAQHHEQVSVREILKTLFSLRIFRQLLVFSFIIHMLRSIFMFWTPKFLVDMGMGTTSAAFNSAVFPILGIIGTVLLGWYTDHYAKNGDRAKMMWIMLTGLVASLFAIGLLVPSRLEYQGWIVIFIGMSGFFMYGPYSMSAGCLSLDIAGSRGAGSCTGMIDGIGYIGGAVAAWATGVLADKLGWAQVFYLLAALSLVCVWAAYIMSKTFQSQKSSS